MRVIDAVKETIADVSSVSSSSFRSDKKLTLETSAIVSFTASMTLMNTQLISIVSIELLPN